jgi:hypothetical protein
MSPHRFRAMGRRPVLELLVTLEFEGMFVFLTLDAHFYLSIYLLR